MTTQKLTNFIGGEFHAPQSNRYIPSFNPATGQPYAEIPDSNSQDIDLAVQEAKRAFPQWSRTTRQERNKILLRIAALLEENIDDFAMAESIDQGKPFQLAKSLDIPRSVYNFRYFAGLILYAQDHKTELDGVAVSYTERMPVGVAGLVSPWNL